MFCVVYEFTIKPGDDDAFVQAWIEGTREIMSVHGGLGSRLHRIGEGLMIGYAQWPSREIWQKFEDSHDPLIFATMKNYCTDVKALYHMDVLADLLTCVAQEQR